MVMLILVFDVLIGSGVARNIHRTGLVVLGVAMMCLFTAGAWRAAVTGSLPHQMDSREERALERRLQVE